MMQLLAAPAPQLCRKPLKKIEKLEHCRGCIAFGDWLFGEWLFEKWSHSENGRILAVPRIGRSEIGRSENGRLENGHLEIGRSENGRSEIGRSENGRSENGQCTDKYASREAIQVECEAYSTLHESNDTEARDHFYIDMVER
jgi:hypothetical protein